MSGERRLHREQKPTKAKRDHLLFVLVIGFIALGIAISLVFARFGWMPAASIAP
jgi:hypothetical protein